MNSLKNSTTLPYATLIIATLLTGFRMTEVKENTASEKYLLDKKESVVTWRGSKLFVPGADHVGYVYISNGELLIDQGQLVSGVVEIDMTTIADKDHGSENSLVDHLKSEDFFDVGKFPISTFSITKVISANAGIIDVTGNLTIKGITHAISFPANIEIKDGVARASGKMNIDRTKWDIRRSSGKFFADLADETISDAIEFEVKLVARKK